MRITIKNKNIKLDMSLPSRERMLFIENLLKETICATDGISVEDYLIQTFNTRETKESLSAIAYYLTKENRNLEILSPNKEREMLKGSKRHTTFSGMGYEDKVRIGEIDIDYQY